MPGAAPARAHSPRSESWPRIHGAGHLGVAWGQFGSNQERTKCTPNLSQNPSPEGSQRGPREVLGWFWRVPRAKLVRSPLLEPSWALSWSDLGALLGLLGPFLGPSWALLSFPEALLEPSWAVLGPSWGNLGPVLSHLGPSWSSGGAMSRNRKNHRKLYVFPMILASRGSSGGVLGVSWAFLEASWAILEAS